MIDPDLLVLLRCPETGQRVREMTPDELIAINAQVATPIPAGLLREDGRLIFPVFDGIPMMLLAEAIPVA
ncbi:MAG TPA: hypothetical protein VIT21_10920 [Chthoniobacterales bacterium]